MPLNLPDGFGEITLRWSLAGDPEVMSSTVACNDDGTSDPTSLAQAAAENWATAFDATTLGNDYTFVGVRYKANRSAAIVEGEFEVNEAGTDAGHRVPQNVSILFRKVTGIAGRAFRGRMYIPPGYLPAAECSDNGMISSTQRADLQLHMDDWIEAMHIATPETNMYLLHTASVVLPTAVNNILCESQVATQRRRLR